MSSPTKNEEDRQLNRRGCSGRVREKRGDMGGCTYKVDRSRFRLGFLNIHAFPCVLAEFFYFMHNLDFGLSGQKFRVRIHPH